MSTALKSSPVRSLAAAGSRRRKSGTAGSGGVSEAPQRLSLRPETWVEAATQVLVDQGIDHVRVDVLAAQLGVTRGSFYWHFRDREDLLRQVLQAWRQRATENVSAHLLRSADDPQGKLRDVISLPHRGRSAVRAARIELAIRAWARRDAMAREAVDEADQHRLDFHLDIFRRLGFPEAEARQRAFVLYSCEVAESLMHHLGSDDDRRARQQFLAQLMQMPVPTSSGNDPATSTKGSPASADPAVPASAPTGEPA